MNANPLMYTKCFLFQRFDLKTFPKTLKDGTTYGFLTIHIWCISLASPSSFMPSHHTVF